LLLDEKKEKEKLVKELEKQKKLLEAEKKIKPGKRAAPETKPKVRRVKYVPSAGKHTVKIGDTLMSLARKYYKNERRWVKIYEANKDNVEKGVIKPGQILIIP
jgi:nucleoid-associated protein YgaU